VGEEWNANKRNYMGLIFVTVASYLTRFSIKDVIIIVIIVSKKIKKIVLCESL
jgi:hypothetical protein